MKEILDTRVIDKVAEALVRASSTLTCGHIQAYRQAIEGEESENSRWAMEMLLKNAEIASACRSPLCDDTGVPHLVLDVGPGSSVTGALLASIEEGVRRGLRQLPGRPMAVRGDQRQRLDQSAGLDHDPGALDHAPILIRPTHEEVTRLHILMFGGGPAIRGRTYRIFHEHSAGRLVDEIVDWAKEGMRLLGCTPGTLAIGVGRSHYEASSLVLQALVDGAYNEQSELEREITARVNAAGIGPLGLGGSTTVLATFMKIGPQRASGVRIVSLRPACCYEPRMASVEV